MIDFCQWYWQILLDASYKELNSVVTPVGILLALSTLQGARNYASNFKYRVEPCFVQMRYNIKACLDDFILHADYTERLLKVPDTFLHIYPAKNLKVSAKKYSLFATNVRWCGRIMDKNGSKMEPRNLEGM